MDLNKSVQKFVEQQRLNVRKWYLLYFHEEDPKQLDQDEIIEIVEQVRAMDPDWYEAMVNAKIHIFEIS
jgi:hypothetical protein